MAQKIINFILNVLLTVVTIIIIVGFYYIYQIKIDQNDYANLFGYTFFEVATASMYPEIEVGDVVIVKKCTINDIDVGDVIEYQIETQSIVHRVTKKEIEQNAFKITTKGDNNNSEDAKPVYEEQIIGKVIFKIKYLGLPSVWLKNLTQSNETIYVETGK